MYDYDEIDRALFALPLEEAPLGLREAILGVTIHAPRPRVAAAPIGLWESVTLGVLFAVLTWLSIEILTNPAFAHQALAALGIFGRTLESPATLLWLGLGASVALWLSFPSLRPARTTVRSDPA